MAKQEKSRGTFSYLYEWARPYRRRYVLSVLFAVCEVGFGIVPFVCLGKITELLVAGEFTFTFGTYGMWLLIAALCWVGHYACHMVSTTISHKATFTVISDVPRACPSATCFHGRAARSRTPYWSVSTALKRRSHISSPKYRPNCSHPLLCLYT